MRKHSICVIGQLPPPIHGLSAALQTILDNEYLNDNYEIRNVDIKDNRKILKNLKEIRHIDADVYYFTIAQSVFGNLRDMGILRTLLKKNKKVVIHYHGSYYHQLYKKMNFLQRKINKSLIAKIDIMIALSEGLRDIFREVIDSKKIRVCENYAEESSLLDDEMFTRKMEKLKFKDHLEVLYLSNFMKTKGYLDLLEAVDQTKKEKLHFHFAGAFFNDEDQKEFFRFIEQKGLADCVTYHGVVKGEEKKNLFRVSDVFVLPTYHPHEGQPISIIEAMGNGLAIITTRQGGIPDVVAEENGLFVEAQSPSAIAQKLAYLADNNNVILNMGRRNRKTAMEKFREIHYVHRLDAIFNEVLEK